jgi:hypothetical protein
MSKENQATDNSSESENGNDNRSALGDMKGVCIAAIWVFIALLLTSIFWPNLTDRTKFFTGNFFNLVIAFAVIAQVIVTRKQWIAMQDSLKESRRATRYSQSAYVTVGGIAMTKFAVGELMEVTIVFSNSGNTPAYDIDTYSRAGPRKEPFQFTIQEMRESGAEHGVASKGILAPNGDSTRQVFSSRFPLTEEGIEVLKDRPYHAWGVVFYRDIFKRQRWTQFCYVWRPLVKDFEICGDCNKTDDQENAE